MSVETGLADGEVERLYFENQHVITMKVKMAAGTYAAHIDRGDLESHAMQAFLRVCRHWQPSRAEAVAPDFAQLGREISELHLSTVLGEDKLAQRLEELAYLLREMQNGVTEQTLSTVTELKRGLSGCGSVENWLDAGRLDKARRAASRIVDQILSVRSREQASFSTLLHRAIERELRDVSERKAKALDRGWSRQGVFALQLTDELADVISSGDNMLYDGAVDPQQLEEVTTAARKTCGRALSTTQADKAGDLLRLLLSGEKVRAASRELELTAKETKLLLATLCEVVFGCSKEVLEGRATASRMITAPVAPALA